MAYDYALNPNVQLSICYSLIYLIHLIMIMYFVHVEMPLDCIEYGIWCE